MLASWSDARDDRSIRAHYDGGSVYRYHPNLGSSWVAVSVDDAGGGDTIVNPGGVLWWPGK